MPDFYFFTNPAQIKPQSNSQNFGNLNSYPIPGTPFGNAWYRLLSKHQSKPTELAKAIAVTNGTICFIEEFTDAGPTKFVTAILKPDTQTLTSIPEVKYFIYRGILKSSLYKISDGKIIGIGTPPSVPDTDPDVPIPAGYTNSIIDKIKSSYEELKMKEPLNPPPLPLKNELGINRADNLANSVFLDTQNLEFADLNPSTNKFDIANPNKVLLDALFTNNLRTIDKVNNKVLIHVNGGDEIGLFKGENLGDFSFQILLNSPGFNPTLEGIRLNNNSPEHFLESDTTNNFQNLSIKQQVLNYLDPVAFYGSLSDFNGESGLGYYDPSQPFNRKFLTTNDEIYNEILVGTVGNGFSDTTLNTGIFFNRNKFYIDIRDRFQNCYQYFKLAHYDNTDYDGNDLEYSFNNDDSANIPISYSNFNGSTWPILAFDDITSQYLRLAFPKLIELSGENESHEVVELYFDNRDRLLTGDLIKSESIDKDEFIFLENRSLSTAFFAKGFTIKIERSSTGKPIASYVKIRHIQHTTLMPDDTRLGNTFYTPSSGYPFHPIANTTTISMDDSKTDHLDFVFPISIDVGGRLAWKIVNGNPVQQEGSVGQTYSESTYIDNTPSTGIDFLGDIGIIKQGSAVRKVILYAYSKTENIIETPEITISKVGVINRGKSFQSAFETKENEIPYLKQIARFLNLRYDDNDKLIFDYIKTKKHLYTNVGFISNINLIYFEINEVDYIQVVNSYKTNFLNDNDFVKNSKVYLRLVPDKTNALQTFQKSQRENEKRIHKIKYVIELVGFKNINNIITTTYITIPNVSFDAWMPAVSARNISVNLDHKEMGKSFGFKIITPNISTSGNISESNPVKLKTVAFLNKTPNTIQKNFLAYQKYWLKNIDNIWRTFGVTSTINGNIYNGNPGLGVQSRTSNYEPDEIGSRGIYTDIINFPYQQSIHIQPDIKIKKSTPLQFRRLLNGEILLNIESDNDERSFMTNKHSRLGQMYFSKPTNLGDIDNIGLTPAHEFGHSLGLIDRYTHVAFAYDRIGTKWEIDPQSCRQVTSFVDPDLDDSFNKEFNWAHNLYSKAYTGKENTEHIGSHYVPSIVQVTPEPNDTYTSPNIPQLFNYQNYLRTLYAYRFKAPIPLGADIDDLNTGTVFITPSQWQSIIDFYNGNENASPESGDYANYVYFFLKNDSSTNSFQKLFTGSFVGLRTNSLSETVIITDNHDPDAPITDSTMLNRNTNQAIGFINPYLPNSSAQDIQHFTVRINPFTADGISDSIFCLLGKNLNLSFDNSFYSNFGIYNLTKQSDVLRTIKSFFVSKPNYKLNDGPIPLLKADGVSPSNRFIDDYRDVGHRENIGEQIWNTYNVFNTQLNKIKFGSAFPKIPIVLSATDNIVPNQSNLNFTDPYNVFFSCSGFNYYNRIFIIYLLHKGSLSNL